MGLGAEKQDEEVLEGNVLGKLFYLSQCITVLPFIVYTGKKSFPLLHSPPGPVTMLGKQLLSAGRQEALRREDLRVSSSAPRAEPLLQLVRNHWGFVSLSCYSKQFSMMMGAQHRPSTNRWVGKGQNPT